MDLHGCTYRIATRVYGYCLLWCLQYDTNVAKREMEELRKSLRWEQVPVVTDFDPRFNQRRPLFFEKLYQPFLPQQNKQEFEDIVDK